MQHFAKHFTLPTKNEIANTPFPSNGNTSTNVIGTEQFQLVLLGIQRWSFLFYRGRWPWDICIPRVFLFDWSANIIWQKWVCRPTNWPGFSFNCHGQNWCRKQNWKRQCERGRSIVSRLCVRSICNKITATKFHGIHRTCPAIKTERLVVFFRLPPHIWIPMANWGKES